MCRVDACVDDPCSAIECPGGFACEQGSCTREDGPPPDPTIGVAAGGGGCICSVPGGTRFAPSRLMRAKLLKGHAGERTYAVIFDTGEDPMEGFRVDFTDATAEEE